MHASPGPLKKNVVICSFLRLGEKPGEFRAAPPTRTKFPRNSHHKLPLPLLRRFVVPQKDFAKLWYRTENYVTKGDFFQFANNRSS
jgi:hypothetical protein